MSFRNKLYKYFLTHFVIHFHILSYDKTIFVVFQYNIVLKLLQDILSGGVRWHALLTLNIKI